jgi:FKBP-type peptidyl-prolyl cis-trans isomerase
MKKFILLLVLIMTTTAAGCNSDKTETPITETDGDTICATSIQAYLDAADIKGRGDKEIQAGDNIVVDYVGRLDEKTVFDTSVESIAKACGKYTEGRDYTSGLPFQVGAGQMIAGFDKGVEGMKI